METIKQFIENLKKELTSAIRQGDIFKANEISANIMMGSMMTIMMIAILICLLLNEFGIFTADKTSMRIAVAIALILEVPAVTVNKIHHGNKPWLKYTLCSDMVILCAVLAGTLGHNASITMMIPVALTVRYYDEKLSIEIAGASALLFALAAFFSVNTGILNLNMINVEPGSVINVDGTLRQSILDMMNSGQISRGSYLTSVMLNDFAPRFLIYSIVAIACCRIAKSGKEMIEIQSDISMKASRIETELNLATEIQTSMLPCIFPAFPEHESLDLYAFNIPAKEVGGDFYDYFKIDDDHVALVMADVSGKGVGAALFMTISKIVIKNELQQESSVSQAMTIANKQICENNDAGLFVTVWAGVYEISTGIMKFVNAGHNPPIIRRYESQTCEYLTDRHGLVLAGFEGSKYKESEIKLNPGDEIFLYTDGVTEATDANNELYGEDRLIKLMNSIYEMSVEDQIRAVKKDIDSFVADVPQFDDITMMGMKITK